jgi:ribosomal protein S20
MPIHKSAKKKMQQDKLRQTRNAKKKNNIKDLLKKARKELTPTSIQAAFSALDKSTKTNFFHKNKVARLKSRLAKRLSVASAK